jgi:chromate transport protein ChrA
MLYGYLSQARLMEETMTRTSHPVAVGRPVQPQLWGRLDTVLFVLAAAVLTLVAAQFALAGFAAFTLDKNPATPVDHAYAAHMVLGVIIAVTTLLILAVALAGRAARGHRRTLRLAVTLAVLALVAEPLLGEAGARVPFLGALHALNGLAIGAVTGWLLSETRRRRATASRGRASRSPA